MINPQNVYDFCNNLRYQIGAGFRQMPIFNGFKMVGEYHTQAGQLLTLVITVTQANVQSQIFDSANRLLFSTNTKTDINRDSKLINFIQKSLTTY